ncbi:hypothetical protein ACP275_04G229000 [Erythranthe tilingii]
MSELCSSSSKRHFCSILISGITLSFSFVLSHPLYFSYFVFFSPYILKLVHFLSPLLITISLLLLAFVSEGFFSACAFMKHCPNEGLQGSDDLGMYEILFVPSLIMEVGENPVEFLEEKPEEDPPLVEIKEDLSIASKIENFAVVNKVVINPADSNGGAGLMEERRLKNFLKILDEFEKMASGVEERKKKVVEPPTICAKADKAVVGKFLLRNGSEADESKLGAADKDVVNNGGKDHHKSMVEDDVKCKKMASFVEERKKDEPPPIGVEVFDKLPVRNGSDAKESEVSVKSFANCNNGGKDDKKTMVKAHSQRISSDANLGNYGSMRKEKEWKRTLACKLFEERHNVDGGEGMDSLWEAYEINSSNGSAAKKTNGNKNLKKNENKSLKKKKSEIAIEEEDEDDEEEEGIHNGQLCCLQALNLSTKKMNLGIGRPNLVKISKAIKGIGWLHHVSKKVHNNNGDRY